MITVFKSIALGAATSYVRHWPLELGKWRLALRSIKWARKLGPTMGSRTIQTKHGFRMRLNLADWVDQHIYATGEYESDVVAVVRAALTPGATALDIGANIGFFSLLFAKLVGPQGKVLALEPQPTAHERLIANINLNGHLVVEVHKAAASDMRGEMEFYCGPADHSGIASLRDHGNSCERMIVATIPADSLLDADRPVQLVKIDVEGAEAKVVVGLQQTINRWKPHLVVEISHSYLQQLGASAGELCRTLCEYGYRMFKIGWDGLEECQGWHDKLPDQFNALFTTNVKPFAGLIKH